jgi:hypothetical protein
VSAKIYIEGGGDSKDLHRRCREGFRGLLLERCGFAGRMPRLVACGGRGQTFDDFKTAHGKAGKEVFVAMLVDSEEPVADGERPWEHLREFDGWDRPAGAQDDQALLMVTCMESWIAADRDALRAHYGANLQVTALPDLTDMESRPRGSLQDALSDATRTCPNRYAKGRRSFEVLGKLDPATLRPHLPSFRRLERILNDRL